MLDLAAGHGLVGMLLAAVEPSVSHGSGERGAGTCFTLVPCHPAPACEAVRADATTSSCQPPCLPALSVWAQVRHVIMFDRAVPQSHAALRDAIASLAPWTVQKLTYFEYDLNRLRDDVEHAMLPSPGPVQGVEGSRDVEGSGGVLQGSGGVQGSEARAASRGQGLAADVPPMATLHAALDALRTHAGRGHVGVVAVHACGALTDTALHLAVRLGASVAVLPCCYTGR